MLYGSLVPLHFRAMPLEDALRALLDSPQFHIGARSRADWAANVLLGVPLGFLLTGRLGRTPARFGRRLLVSVCVLSGCVVLSAGIEFSQAFFPPRTPSMNDLRAQGLGALIGITWYWCLGSQLEQWLGRFRTETRGALIARYLLAAYVVSFAIYQLMPFDLSISPAELFRKWQDGRVVLMPFGYPQLSWAEAAYQFGVDVLLWAPVSALVLLGSRLSPLGAMGLTIALASVVEAGQLLVFSRVTDVTDLLAAAVGGGAVAALWAARSPARAPGSARGWRAPTLWWLGFFLWAGALVMIFWYPFDFVLDARTASKRLWSFTRVPFLTYYYGSEFNALTQLLRKTLFFAPLGICTAGALARLREGGLSRLAGLIAGILVGSVALGIELGQVLLPGKVADLTDLGLATIGGLAGYLGASYVSRRLRADPQPKGQTNSPCKPGVRP